MDGGERMPLLVDSHTGLGVFESTAFSLSMRSKGNHAIARCGVRTDILFGFYDESLPPHQQR
jgi:hypothetical protein